MRFTIKKRIYLSFSLLVFLFVINAIITISTISYNKKLSNHISGVIDPSLYTMDDLKRMISDSKMYTTNWVFFRADKDDKDALIKLFSTDYPVLKSRLNSCTIQWKNKNWIDSLNNVEKGFEQLHVFEKSITNSLMKFDDYDDPVKKLGAEGRLENTVLPKTAELMTSLERIIAFGESLKKKENKSLNNSSAILRILIIFLAITIIILGVFFSVYMTRKIIKPINRIRDIVNDLGKGIIQRTNRKTNGDEIGEMIRSVNNLSEKLQVSASFAHEIGNRNFNIPFKPLSDEDALGKALITMRDNLKSSDERLNEAQHIAHLGSWERDLKNKKVIWSDELFGIFEVDQADFAASYEAFLDFICIEDREYVNSFVSKYPDDHKPYSYETKITTKNGKTKIIYVLGKVIVDEQGDPIKTYGVVQDITERKIIEQELIDSEKHNRNLFNQSTIGLALANIDGTLEDVNETYAKIIGYTVDEAKQLNYWDITPEQYNEKEKEKLEELKISGHYTSYEKEYIHKKGYLVPVRMSGVFIEKDGEKYILSSVEDITERKKSETSLRESEEQIKTIYNAVLDAVIIIDDKGKIVKWDSKAEALFGWKEDELMGTLLSESIIPHENREAHERGMKHFLKTGVGPVLGKTIEVRALNKSNESLDISLSISPSFVKDKYQFIGFVRDITSRKEAEAALKRNNEELKKANNELDEFVYSVSHDLRAPLSSMLGVVEITEEETRDTFVLEHLSMLKGSITRLDGFIQDILNYSRNARTEIKKEEINFKEMIDGIVSNLQYMSGSNHRVEIQTDVTDHSRFISDKNRVSIVLNNLISNAIRYQNPKAQQSIVNIKVDTSDTETHIIVKDNGIGISKQLHDKIFDMFFRVSENSVGSGLGLYIVKETIHKLNGRIEVESELGKGTAFSLHIPNN